METTKPTLFPFPQEVFMRYLTLAVFCVLAFGATSAQACVNSSDKISGNCCPILGQTAMDKIEKNIIACVCESGPNCANGYIWKAMAGSTSTLDFQCPAGMALTTIIPSNIPLTLSKCATPTVKTTIVYNDIIKYVPPPPPPVPCPALRRSCINNVGCSGGCPGWFAFNLPDSTSTAPVAFSGSCEGGDRACGGGDSCSFSDKYYGTATCDTTTGTWQCSWYGIRTSTRNSRVVGTGSAGGWGGACVNASPYS